MAETLLLLDDFGLRPFFLKTSVYVSKVDFDVIDSLGESFLRSCKTLPLAPLSLSGILKAV